jgi:TM2 domain-containing membrane protein YozV
MNQQLLMSLPGITPEEMLFIQEATKELTEDQQRNFVMMYSSRRKDPQTIMICTLVGFLGFGGIQRFMIGQTGMGILYLFTWGLCWIGTIIDLVNYQKLTLEFNQQKVVEAIQLTRGMR